MKAMTLDDYMGEVREDAQGYIDEHLGDYDYFNDVMEDMMASKDVTGGAWGKLGVTSAETAISELVNDKWFMETQFPGMMDREINDDLTPVYVDVEIRRFCLKYQWASLRDYFEAKKEK